jgi:hypothetical protein
MYALVGEFHISLVISTVVSGRENSSFYFLLNDTNNPDELLNQRRLYYLLPKIIVFANQNWEQ